MGLDELIEALEAEDPERVLPLGFAHPHSYRGYYEDLAFEPAVNVTVGSMLACARAALGGWTEVWLSRVGQASGETIGPTLLRLLLAQPSPSAAAVSGGRGDGEVVKVCATCKHWYGGPLPEEHGSCYHIRNDGHSLAYIDPADYYDLPGTLMTRADFGCVLHEEKP